MPEFALPVLWRYTNFNFHRICSHRGGTDEQSMPRVASSYSLGKILEASKCKVQIGTGGGSMKSPSDPREPHRFIPNSQPASWSRDSSNSGSEIGYDMISQFSTFASLRWSTVRLFARMSTSCRNHKELHDFHVRTSCGHGDRHMSAVLHVKLSFAATMAMRRNVWPCETRKTPRLLVLQLQQGSKDRLRRARLLEVLCLLPPSEKCLPKGRCQTSQEPKFKSGRSWQHGTIATQPGKSDKPNLAAALCRGSRESNNPGVSLQACGRSAHLSQLGRSVP